MVLSNNDGCVISRSNEAKALGIKMGAAAFECEPLFKKHKVQVFSSNFSLYADMSARIMQTLAEFSADIEIYSIDEAFLFVPTEHPTGYGQYLRKLVKQRTGIPISVGIGPSKTLAKAANKLVKKQPRHDGVLDLTNHPEIDKLLASLPVEDVWGVGYQYTKLLTSAGIVTARDLKYAPDGWVRKKMTIVGLKTLLELRGTSCIDLIDQVPAKQSIMVSRSFGKLVSEKQQVQEAIAAYTIRAAQKLRRDRSLAGQITVFVSTSRYHDHQHYFNSISFTCPIATDYTPALLDAATACLDAIFRKGLLYKRAGVLLSNIVSAQEMQLTIFNALPDVPKQKDLMKMCDKINARFGSHALSYAAAGIDQSWKSKRLKKSAHFTTNWHELLTIKI